MIDPTSKRPTSDLGTDPAPSSKASARWVGALLVGRRVLRFGGLGSGGVLMVFQPSAVYDLMVAMSVSFALHHGIHVHLKYSRQRGSLGARLRGLMRLKLALVALFVSAGVYGIVWRPAPAMTAALALILFVAVMLLTGAVVELADTLELDCGSLWLKGTPAFRAIKRALRPHASTYGRLPLGVLNAERSEGEASWYVVGLLTLLLMLGTAEGAAAIPGLRALTNLDGVAATSKGSGYGKHDRGSHRSHTSKEPATHGAGGAPTELETPTYEEVCRGDVTPGYPATEPQAAALKSLFDEAGAFVAGCAGPANAIPGDPNVWWSIGKCDGELRSMGVATRGKPAALILQQVAAFAEVKAQGGVLTGASRRIASLNGDFQILETSEGDYVAARATTSLGENGMVGEPQSCKEMGDDNAPYTFAPPGLLGVWAMVARKEWVWPLATSGEGALSTRFNFVAGDDGSTIKATAECSNQQSCTMQFDGQEVTGEESSYEAAQTLQLVAPAKTS